MDNSFFESVYRVVAQIPHGRVTTYGIIAEHLGSKRSARMVGWALNNTKKISSPLPAHRVVNRKGLLTGKNHFWGTQVMADLLRSEGLQIENDQILDFKEKLWFPEG
ncbi:MAG: MGMT family protein [Bacteroidetes bacterium]|jgi:methylated-DNA-protein-cysteine methyltransferase-like protein|nr:MGMT family protein [Bacteroidota bacterium]